MDSKEIVIDLLKINIINESNDNVKMKNIEALEIELENITIDKSLVKFLIRVYLKSENEEIRLYIFKILLKHFPKSLEATFLQYCIKDNNKEISYLAAMELGDTGIELLHDIITNKYVLNTNYELRMKIALHNLIKIQEEKCIPYLLKVYPKLYHKMKIKIIKCLSKFEDKSILKLYNKEKFSDTLEIKLEAITALGNFGNESDIASLNKLLHDAIDEEKIESAIKTSIARIKSRLGPKGKGMLSVTEKHSEEGALSISNNDDTGALSLPEGKEVIV
jgi:hypothetical protein